MKQRTILALCAALFLLMGWEAYTIYVGSGTISEVVLDISRRYPVLPFAVGVLMGHFFWPQRCEHMFDD